MATISLAGRLRFGGPTETFAKETPFSGLRRGTMAWLVGGTWIETIKTVTSYALNKCSVII